MKKVLMVYRYPRRGASTFMSDFHSSHNVTGMSDEEIERYRAGWDSSSHFWTFLRQVRGGKRRQNRDEEV